MAELKKPWPNSDSSPWDEIEFVRDALFSKSKNNIGAIILAAGSASRIGHRPKCLLELNNEPLLQRLVHATLHAGINSIVVVLGHYAEQIKPIVTRLPVTLAHNANPDAGQNSSLHCGLRALPQSLDAVMVLLADQPLIAAQDIDDLLRAYRNRPQTAEVVVPMSDQRPGNPVIFSDAVRTAILNRDDAFGCKQWQQENSERVYRWQTANEHYRIDIDSADDIAAFIARTGKSLRWPADIE
ncbi:MAG: nucleotidyltransferase family protein [Spongiibacteraceae bacterium]